MPDLPLYPGNSPLYGLGLWKSLSISLTAELLLFFVSLAVYNRGTMPLNKKGSIGFWSLAGFLFIIHLANIFGPPPPNTNAVAWGAQLQWVFIFWAYWIDANRTLRRVSSPISQPGFV